MPSPARRRWSGAPRPATGTRTETS
jgi:hypothetical protein